MKPARAPPLQCGVAGFVMPGHVTSGDLHAVHYRDNGALVAVIDGLGHGDEAAAAARSAKATIAAHALESIDAIVRRCHEALRGTRGVVMSIAAIDADRGLLRWLAIGNVRGRLCRPQFDANHLDEELLLRPGVVGATLPALQTSELLFRKCDTLIFATDGIRGDAFLRSIAARDSPDELARQILANHRRGNDDALVLVAKRS